MKPESVRIAARLENDWASRSRIQASILALATGFGMYLCYLLATPFLPALTAALALAVLFTPFQRWLE
jgi:predicted PurR-regulated permease PerM